MRVTSERQDTEVAIVGGGPAGTAAAIALDPLSSQGLTQALTAGLMAADRISRALRDNGSVALDEYASWIDQEFAIYLGERAAYYGREQRWPGSPFWRRRRRPLTALS